MPVKLVMQRGMLPPICTPTSRYHHELFTKKKFLVGSIKAAQVVPIQFLTSTFIDEINSIDNRYYAVITCVLLDSAGPFETSRDCHDCLAYVAG